MRHIWVFLDESGTHARADHLLVGAVVVPNRESVEAAVAEAFADAALQSANWNNDDEIAAFIERGFHFSQDNVSVRNEFIRRISAMNVRVHAAYSRSGTGSEWRTRATAMYHQLTRSILRRYQDCEIHFVFEREQGMNSRYARIIGQAAQDVTTLWERGRQLSYDVSIGGKDDPALGLVDYILAAISARLTVMDDNDFRARYVNAFAGHVAHLLDYDAALRSSSRALTLVATGAERHDGRVRVAPGSRRSELRPMPRRPPSPDDVASVVSTPSLALRRIGVRQLPAFLGIGRDELADLLNRLAAGKGYEQFTILVKGRHRRLTVPSDETLKAVQRRILGRLSVVALDMPACVHGYVAGRSHISNATAHAGRPFQQKFDLKDFFPSIGRDSVAAVLRELGSTTDAADTLSRLVTFDDALPMGACTSPLLSNLCLRATDVDLNSLAGDRNLTYTRYADDLTFSGAEPFDVRKEVRTIVAANGFRLNHKKTVSAKYGQALYVTGLSTSDRSGPRLPKRFKRRLRQVMFLIEKFGLSSFAERSADWSYDRSPDDVDFIVTARLQGALRYAKAVEPQFVKQLEAGFPAAFDVIMPVDDPPVAVEEHERMLMARIDGRSEPLAGAYTGTRRYSTELSTDE